METGGAVAGAGQESQTMEGKKMGRRYDEIERAIDLYKNAVLRCTFGLGITRLGCW